MEYEAALRRMVLDPQRAEATIKAQGAELERVKKELAKERSRHHRERQQAIQTAEGLEEELETARSKIA